MNAVIPERLAPVVEAVVAICGEFDSHEKFHSFGPGRWICDVNVADDEVQHVAFLLDTDAPLLAVYVIVELPGATGFIEALAKAVTRANYGLLPGCFEIDLETGETRYRSVLNLFTEKVPPQAIAHLLSGALLMTKAYAPAFQKIVESNVDPLAAIDEVETE